MDEFSLFVFFGGLVVIGIFLAIGKWYPGSGAEQVDWLAKELEGSEWASTVNTRLSEAT